METQRTRWEAREQNALLALETEEWREKRAVAEDPATPADTLAQLATEAFIIYQNDLTAYVYGPAGKKNPLTVRRNHLLFAALAAHPNTPPDFLSRLCFVKPGRPGSPRTVLCAAVYRAARRLVPLDARRRHASGARRAAPSRPATKKL